MEDTEQRRRTNMTIYGQSDVAAPNCQPSTPPPTSPLLNTSTLSCCRSCPA
ncbi:hypothetical protein JOB18_017065, partial [Solea senegalensis]